MKLRNVGLALIIAALIGLCAVFAQAQNVEPKLEGYMAPDGSFVSLEMAAGGGFQQTLVAKYLQMYATAPTCSRKGQMYYDTVLNKARVCTATPSTWETVASGSSVGTVTTSGSPASPQLAKFSSATAITTATAVDVSTPLFCSDAGANDTYACSIAPTPTLVTGTHYRFKANTANTGASTINFNSIGAKTIVKVAGGLTTDLADNDIRAGQWVDLVYDGTNMQMQSTLGNAATGGVTGTGTVNTIPKVTNATGPVIGDSSLKDDGTQVNTIEKLAVGQATAAAQVDVLAAASTVGVNVSGTQLGGSGNTAASNILTVTGTAGQANTTGSGGSGAPISLTAGTGGDVSSGSGVSGTASGAGGTLLLTAGAGGNATAGSSVRARGGDGGGLTLTSGNGGTSSNSGAAVRGGNAGNLTMSGGTGGVVAAAKVSGAGGSFTISGGTGGGNSTSGGTAGDGGALTLDAGAAGAASGGASSGTNGAITLGTTNSSAVTVGRTGTTTTLPGVVAITNATDSSSSSTGALIVTGGIAINKRIFIPSITASSGLQTAVLCQSSGGEMIADSVACLASSARFKMNIKPLNQGLNEVMSLRPVTFFYRPEFNGALQSNPNFNGERVGFLAEEVQKIDPRFVGVEKDGTTAHSVRYEQMVPLLVNAIKEQQVEIKAQQAEIKELRGAVRKLNVQQKHKR